MLPFAVIVLTVLLCACSVRINERKHRGVADNKKMAYLVDLKTIAISKCDEDKQSVSHSLHTVTCIILRLIQVPFALL